MLLINTSCRIWLSLCLDLFQVCYNELMVSWSLLGDAVPLPKWVSFLNEFPSSLVVLLHQDRQKPFHLSRPRELLCPTDFLIIENKELYSHVLFWVTLIMVQGFFISVRKCSAVFCALLFLWENSLICHICALIYHICALICHICAFTGAHHCWIHHPLGLLPAWSTLVHELEFVGLRNIW